MIIVLVIVLIISFVIIAYLILQRRQPKANTENKSKDKDNSKDIYENPDKVDGNYEQVENEQSTYTAFKSLGKDENDDHENCHLNEVLLNNVNQKKTET